MENPNNQVKQKILMLSWRDMKHPQKGGAEVVSDVYLSHLAKQGHDVTLFSAAYPNSPKEEQYNNYKIIRKGHTSYLVRLILNKI